LANFLKVFLKSIFGNSYIPLRERISYLIKNFKGGSFSLNQMDKKLEKHLNFDGGFYVELGANDGVKQSNTLYFELRRNWRGVLVEPSPSNFQNCIANRSAKNFIFCNACVGFEYKEKYVDMKYANLMSISDNLNLQLNKERHIKNAKKHLKNNEVVISFGAKARTLNEILEESKAPKMIDFLSLDVEGAELEVLKGINFENFNFKYMLIEVRDLKTIQSFLEKYNYCLVEQFSHHDFLFKYYPI